MNAQYTVVAVENDSVTITPVAAASSCTGCSGSCSSCSIRFSVANGRHLDVKPGQKVKIGMSARHEAVQGILSLFFPVACAVGGFFASGALASFIRIAAKESFKAACVIAFLAAGCCIVLLITRKRPNPEKLEIIEIC